MVGWMEPEIMNSGFMEQVCSMEFYRRNGLAFQLQKIHLNGMDFWRRENDHFVEKWVFVEMIHLFQQFGVDLLQRIPSR